MGLDDVFQDPPVWDTDTESEASSIRSSRQEQVATIPHARGQFQKQDTTGETAFQHPPTWDTDLQSEESFSCQKLEGTEEPERVFKIRDLDDNNRIEKNDNTLPPRMSSPTSSHNPSSRLSSISEHEPVFVRPSLIRDVLGPSFVNGTNTIDLSVLSVSGSDRDSKILRAKAQVGSTISLEEGSSRALNFAPRRLLDVESGKSVILTSDQRWFPQDEHDGYDEAVVVAARSLPPMSEQDPAFFRTRAQSLQEKMANGCVRDFQANDEVGIVGGAWRGILKRLMLHSYDEVNALMLTRQMQLSMPFLTGYEAYVLGQLVEALDGGRKQDIQYTLNVAFRNRNCSRVLVQLVGSRYDFIWHWSTMISWNRPFDAWGQLPIVGFTSFPPTENSLNTFNHALTSILRLFLGQGNWLTRVITGREGLVTDDPRAAAQNLAAESNGFELANRNQYGTNVGRCKTNEFRFMHRLPTDESIVRTFVAQPMSTMLNNGVVHVLRQLSNHWERMLSQQNFAHQRMEQLNPFETLRFHMPVVLLTLSSLRGRNEWDSSVLGPVVKRLQGLKPSLTVDSARYLVHELKETVIMNVCAGVATVVDPFRSWLCAIKRALDEVEEEAKEVHKIASSVDIGIHLGHDLITQVKWMVPNDKQLKQAILSHIRGLGTGDVSERAVSSAMTLITPRDKRTLIELVKNDFVTSRPAQLLLSRAKTLLQRELRREILNETIRELSKGNIVTEPEEDEWYWLQFGHNGYSGVYAFDGKVMGSARFRFVHVETRVEKYVELADDTVLCRAYVPVGEAISRAQKAFMTIELEFGKRFAYNAFMEFSYMRDKLQRLMVISQVTCEEIDNARLNLLGEVQRSHQTKVSAQELEVGKVYYAYSAKQNEYVPFTCKKEHTSADFKGPKTIVTVPPQSMIVIGGGPTGLLTAIHCSEAVLASGGTMKVYEARDALDKGGSTFERAQIVRLDARWIAMLRYHLGTGFEDIFIPASGETDAQLGNTLPDQGFVEIAIKDLEQILHVEVSKMWSKGLLRVYTGSKAAYDHESNTLTKLGEHLKKDDAILRNVDEEGRVINGFRSWKVIDVVELRPLGSKEVLIGEEYCIYIRLERRVVKYMLVGIDLRTHTYVFTRVGDSSDELQVTADNWPTVYPVGAGTHGELHSIVVECRMAAADGGRIRESLPMEQIRNQKFIMDVGHTHVAEAVGKPAGSTVHFQVTTTEPYGVFCAEGLKVSLGMHNFGAKRWRTGIIDDIRSQTDQNTRIIGDFTKFVRSSLVMKKMLELITDEKDQNWQLHFDALVAEAGFVGMSGYDNVVTKIQQACAELANAAPTFRRQTLQTRFFETGDVFYLGMEFMREYVVWRDELAAMLVEPARMKAVESASKAKVEQLKTTLMHHIDRLWYDGVLEVIRTGDVYNPGARHRVPRLYLVNSQTDEKLGRFPVGESFRLSDSPGEKYEILIKRPTYAVVRNVEGFISKIPRSARVRRESNLTRTPDGKSESRIALSTFPVAHFVNHRTVRLNDSEKGYIFTFIGDEQATPHFMRYSGLTGACINAMLFNNFIKKANDGVPFIDRLREYSGETNWSNGEVVQRGTGGNYGEDGFLRPGFSYDYVISYLHSKVIEFQETGQDLSSILSRDWKNKLAASLVPRGMEMNESYIRTLHQRLLKHVFHKFAMETAADKRINHVALEKALTIYGTELSQPRKDAVDEESFWNEFLAGLDVDKKTKSLLRERHVFVAKHVSRMCRQIIEHAKEAYLYDRRISSELFNQPKSVDSIVDDFAVEAQNFANALTQSAAFASGALAFKIFGETIADAFSEILAVLNIFVSFSTMTNAARYKIRNEEARIVFVDEKMLGVLKAVFATMPKIDQDFFPIEENPFVISLEQHVSVFVKNLQYYNFNAPKEFLSAFDRLKSNVTNPAEIQLFMKLLTTKFMVDTYHVNSYVQESLVTIYKSLDEMLRLSTMPASNECDKDGVAMDLYRRLFFFQKELEGTLHRGATRFGFVKRRRLLQWDCIVMFKYLYSLLCCSSRHCILPTAPISSKILSIIKHAKHLSNIHGDNTLCREIRDLETLHWATRESDIASLVFMSGFFVFVASIVFTIAFIFRIAVLTELAFWLSLTSGFGAILGSFHLWRKLLILVKLGATLSAKIRIAYADDRLNLCKVRRVTMTQIALTLTRLLSAGAAAVALPWSVANKAFAGVIGSETEVPFWLALGSVCSAISATLLFFVVEFRIRYHLPPKLGDFVCESFRSEIEDMQKLFSRPMNDIDTKQVQGRETWEYVAREFLHRYRFDAVFAADRFGSILQYLQGGMDRRQ